MGFTSVTLIKEDGTGSNANANTYASAADADTYFSKRALSNVWFGDTDINRTMALQWATRLIDVGFEFYGRRALETQPLAWPRQDVPDRDGALGGYLATNLVPAAIVAATCELAMAVMKDDATVQPEGDRIKEFQEPAPDSTRTVYFQAPLKQYISPLVETMLRPYGRCVLQRASGAVPLQRS